MTLFFSSLTIAVDANADGALAVLSPDGKTLVYGGTSDSLTLVFSFLDEVRRVLTDR